jgi:GntR family transcriptional regulator / MocR family aminotransferase
MEPAILASLLHLDPQADETLVSQLYRALSQAVRSGQLPSGSRLPSTREAASTWGVGRNTVVAAYELLAAEGVIALRRGAAPSILALPDTKPDKAEPLPGLSNRGALLAQDPRIAPQRDGILSPGEPDPDLFPFDDWALSLRRVTRLRHGMAEGYGQYVGLPELRAALADQLNRHRGLSCTPDQVIVTPGTQSALSLLAQALANPGDQALIEDPGYGGARLAFAAAGLKVVPLPVDAEGANCEYLPAETAARLIYVTPSTQYPSGVRMTLARRMALLDLARAIDAWVIEDDYDSEFLWHGREIAALGALSGAQRVIYLGSAAKTLLPGLRIGWMVVPEPLVQPLRAAQRSFGLAANLQTQAALAELIGSGRYRAHLRRITRVYAARRDVLRQTLQSWLGDQISLSEPDGGLQIVARFTQTVDETALRDRLRAEGYAVAGLSEFQIAEAQPAGLVLGFANMTPRRARRFAKALSAALRG